MGRVFFPAVPVSRFTHDHISLLLAPALIPIHTLAASRFKGLWTNVVGGMVFDRVGGVPTMVGGGVLAGAGYAITYFALRNQWSVYGACAGWFIAGHGSGWIYISTLFSNLKNFGPAQRGYVVSARCGARGIEPPPPQTLCLLVVWSFGAWLAAIATAAAVAAAAAAATVGGGGGGGAAAPVGVLTCSSG